jgi:formylglycine-generating enzyme required for sulfatase activity
MMVLISGGTFTMGSPTIEPNRYSDENRHSVTVSSFRMSKYQVTQEQYEAVMGVNPSAFSSSPATGEIQGKRPVEQISWYDANSGYMTHEVGLKPANVWGLYDMHGNVWEWCWACYGTYPVDGLTDYCGLVAGDDRILRGGSWDNYAEVLRSAYRNYNPYYEEYNFMALLTQYISFFVSPFGEKSVTDELNDFLRSHRIVNVEKSLLT